MLRSSFRQPGSNFGPDQARRSPNRTEQSIPGRWAAAPWRIFRRRPTHFLVRSNASYNLLFRWFVGLDADEKVWDVTVFTKNRERLLEAEVARLFFEGVRSHAVACRLMSDEHFSVDGTLLEAWASYKSIQPISKEKNDSDQAPKSAGSNPDADFKGQKRMNDTHRSVAEPDARLARKGKGKEARLCLSGNVLMENRNGLIVDADVLLVEGNHETVAALALLADHAGIGSTVGADKLYDNESFVKGCRQSTFVRCRRVSLAPSKGSWAPRRILYLARHLPLESARSRSKILSLVPACSPRATWLNHRIMFKH
jgi:hypothetical protein